VTKRQRPTLHLHLASSNNRVGEIALADLARLSQQTQRLVTRIASGMVDDHDTGRPRQSVANATTLTLIGLRSGSTVLDIALPETNAETLNAEDMPPELGEMALGVFADSLEILSEDEPHPVLPVGVDDSATRYIDEWLSTLRRYTQVAVEAQLNSRVIRVEFAPKTIRAKLKMASSQPSLPYVSANDQALTGRLYAQWPCLK
jgi:hypothetical protein